MTLVVIYWGNSNSTASTFSTGYRTEQEAIDAIVQSIKDEIASELDQEGHQEILRDILEELSGDHGHKFDTLESYYEWLIPTTKEYIINNNTYDCPEELALGWHYIVQRVNLPESS